MCPARRAALSDAVQASRALARKKADQDRCSAAALAVLWEAVACMELAANTAAPWVDPKIESPNGAWVEMTYYDPTRVNRFYESSRNWTDERFAILSSHRFRRGDDASMLGIMQDQGVLEPQLIDTFEKAEAATIRFLREQFETLAASWSEMRAYAAAFEHGLLLVPSEVGQVVNDDDELVPHAIVVWETRRDASRGAIGDSVTGAIETAEQAGRLAIDVAEHVADARLRVVDALEFEDGKVYLQPWQRPFPYWVKRGALTEEELVVLDRAQIAWVEESD